MHDSALMLTGHWTAIAALTVFAVAYLLVIAEETLHLRKSKPMMVAAGLIWMLVAYAHLQAGEPERAAEVMRHNLLEFAELFLFLLAAMTYINTMEEVGVFQSLRAWLISRGFSLAGVYWMTGLLAFFISPAADNLTTALVMATVVMAIGRTDRKFVVIACINVVVAANAGGAFSPFGDITTLMVWQKGIVRFHEFFYLFAPSLINWLVPAVIMSFAVPRGHPEALQEKPQLQRGAFGLGVLKFYGYYLKTRGPLAMRWPTQGPEEARLEVDETVFTAPPVTRSEFDVFKALERAEWDTLMFFYGIMLCVGGLGALGYLSLLSHGLYFDLGPTAANILVGVLSALIDNIPLMFAVLSMNPDMSHGQWLLVTLTTGVGGSLLSIGSAAGVGVMGQARGIYTFAAHLRWSWAIALGYAAGVAAHFLLNAESFHRAAGQL